MVLKTSYGAWRCSLMLLGSCLFRLTDSWTRRPTKQDIPDSCLKSTYRRYSSFWHADTCTRPKQGQDITLFGYIFIYLCMLDCWAACKKKMCPNNKLICFKRVWLQLPTVWTKSTCQHLKLTSYLPLDYMLFQKLWYIPKNLINVTR